MFVVEGELQVAFTHFCSETDGDTVLRESPRALGPLDAVGAVLVDDAVLVAYAQLAVLGDLILSAGL